MVKLVVVDMDGTLLNDKKEIHTSFWETAELLKQKNIRLAVASGRQYYTLLHQFDRLKDDMLFMSDNGAFVADKTGPISITSFEKEEVKKIVARGEEVQNAWLVCSGAKAGYVQYNGRAFLEKVHTYYERLEQVDDFNEVEDVIMKMTFCDFGDAHTNSHSYFEEFSHDFNVAVAGAYWLDITPKSANKGIAVAAMQKALQIDPEETMIFGDYYNDLPMMPMAKYSFAMKNAQPAVKASANYVTKFSNNENGVVETIREWLL